MCLLNLHLWYKEDLIQVSIIVLLNRPSFQEKLLTIMIIRDTKLLLKIHNHLIMITKKGTMIQIYLRHPINKTTRLIRSKNVNNKNHDSNIGQIINLFKENLNTKKVMCQIKFKQKDHKLAIMFINLIRVSFMELHLIKLSSVLNIWKNLMLFVQYMSEKLSNLKDNQLITPSSSPIKYKSKGQYQLAITNITSERIDFKDKVDTDK